MSIYILKNIKLIDYILSLIRGLIVKNPIINEIKNLVADRDMTLTELAKSMGLRLNRRYSLASLSQKLRNGTIPYKEVLLIADILNYKITYYDLVEKKLKI